MAAQISAVGLILFFSHHLRYGRGQFPLVFFLMQVPITFEAHRLRIRESKTVTVVLEEEAKEMLVLDVSKTEQLKLIPVKLTKQNIGGDKTEDFALMGSYNLLCVTSAGSVKKVQLKREVEGLKIHQIGVIDYICRYCGELQRKSSHYITHIYLCHRGPINCKYCNIECIDRHAVIKHAKNCKYKCNVAKCMWPGTKNQRDFRRHMKKHGVLVS